MPPKPAVVLSDFRPDEIITGYWKQVLDIGQDDTIWPVEFIKEEL